MFTYLIGDHFPPCYIFLFSFSVFAYWMYSDSFRTKVVLVKYARAYVWLQIPFQLGIVYVKKKCHFKEPNHKKVNSFLLKNHGVNSTLLTGNMNHIF